MTGDSLSIFRKQLSLAQVSFTQISPTAVPLRGLRVVRSPGRAHGVLFSGMHSGQFTFLDIAYANPQTCFCMLY
jgi:hypothetical protein